MQRLDPCAVAAYLVRLQAVLCGDSVFVVRDSF